jgi:hypothetical protein
VFFAQDKIKCHNLAIGCMQVHHNFRNAQVNMFEMWLLTELTLKNIHYVRRFGGWHVAIVKLTTCMPL